MCYTLSGIQNKEISIRIWWGNGESWGIRKSISRGCSFGRRILVHDGVKVHSRSDGEVEGTGGVEEDKEREVYFQ